MGDVDGGRWGMYGGAVVGSMTDELAARWASIGGPRMIALHHCFIDSDSNHGEACEGFDPLIIRLGCPMESRR